MNFFRGYALIRVGTMAINTTYLKGVRLLGIGTIFWSCFQDKLSPFCEYSFACKTKHYFCIQLKLAENCDLGSIDMLRH